MRLVDDRVLAVRDHLAEGALPHRGVRAQQVVIDDDDVGLGGALPHARDEAVVVARTLGADAVLGVAAMSFQNGESSGQVLDLGAVAGLGVAATTRRSPDGLRVSSAERIAALSRNASNRCRQR